MQIKRKAKYIDNNINGVNRRSPIEFWYSLTCNAEAQLTREMQLGRDIRSLKIFAMKRNRTMQKMKTRSNKENNMAAPFGKIEWKGYINLSR